MSKSDKTMRITDEVSPSKKEIETQNFVADYYEDIRYKNPYSVLYHKWLNNKIISLIEPNGRILDNGCGQGHFVEENLSSREVIGLDISINMLKHAKNRISSVVLADSQTLPFKNNAFDTVFSRSLLHHLPNPNFGVDEITRTLKPGGRVIFIDPLASLVNIIPRIILNKKSRHFSEEHKSFKKSEFLSCINRDLTIESVNYFGYIAYPILGFPDVLNFIPFIPFKRFFVPFLIRFDEFLSKLPVIRKQAWGIVVVARKKQIDTQQAASY